jgi:hypothetical protein
MGVMDIMKYSLHVKIMRYTGSPLNGRSLDEIYKKSMREENAIQWTVASIDRMNCAQSKVELTGS